jgi:hypothetical protein
MTTTETNPAPRSRDALLGHLPDDDAPFYGDDDAPFYAPSGDKDGATQSPNKD